MPYTKKNGSKAGKKAKDQRQGSSGEKKDKEHKGATTEERAARQMIEPQEALVERELAAVPGFHDEHGAQPGKRPFPVVGIGASAGGRSARRIFPERTQRQRNGLRGHIPYGPGPLKPSSGHHPAQVGHPGDRSEGRNERQAQYRISASIEPGPRSPGRCLPAERAAAGLDASAPHRHFPQVPGGIPWRDGVLRDTFRDGHRRHAGSSGRQGKGGSNAGTNHRIGKVRGDARERHRDGACRLHHSCLGDARAAH